MGTGPGRCRRPAPARAGTPAPVMTGASAAVLPAAAGGCATPGPAEGAHAAPEPEW